ncbi:hypothetical protein [Polyangium sp. 15x6]|uniref:hypothetical protein n=1 Tax=Polyangium sp. 15x6 TaxID=3042687 RepID=UPI00249C3A97|nr:hypothetical protein [Polyangium sp. 15x6]MDI3290401.1 hypothetical protein [Polyangium sp. 15x6]
MSDVASGQSSGTEVALDRLDWPVRGLSPRARRVVFAYAEAMYADEDEKGAIVPASPAICERATAWLDHSVGRASSDLRRGFAVLTWLLEMMPLFVIGAFSRMSRLPIARRVGYLEALEQSQFGFFALLLVAFKVPTSVAVFEEGEELASTGFDRPSTTARRRLPVAPERAP